MNILALYTRHGSGKHPLTVESVVQRLSPARVLGWATECAGEDSIMQAYLFSTIALASLIKLPSALLDVMTCAIEHVCILINRRNPSFALVA
jgi:hypothetical protein